MDEAINNIITAIEKNRTDIVRSIISACEKCEHDQEGDIEVSKILNKLSTPFGTLLHLATKMSQADTVRTLLSAGADPGVRNSAGEVALDLAEEPNVVNIFSEELLQATAQSNVARVTQLLASGVSINLLDSPDTHNTPLHWATCFGNREIVHCLIERKANVNLVNSDGHTPLHDAINRGDMGIIEELLAANAATNIKATQGKYADQCVDDIAESDPALKKLMIKYKNQFYNGLDGSITDTDSSDGFKQEEPANGLHANDDLAKRLAELLTFPSAMCPPDSLVTDSRLNLLWPKPQRLVQKEGKPFKPTGLLLVYAAASQDDDLHSVCDTWHRHGYMTEILGLEMIVQPYLSNRFAANVSANQAHVVCEINPKLFNRTESYRIYVSQKLVRMQASDQAGLFYGVSSLMQLLRICEEDGIPPLQIHDWPALRDRGLLLDMSKGRIPTLDSLRGKIMVWAAMKLNQLHLYMRFRIEEGEDLGHWQIPYTPSELMNIHWICKHLHMDVIPVLDVAPSVTYDRLPDLHSAFLQFCKCFSTAGMVGVGPRLTSLLMDVTDSGELNMADVTRLLPIRSHQVVQLCAFAFHDDNDLLTQFPFDMMLVEYGFQATYEFERLGKNYAENGVPFSVMPGSGAWNSVAGCPEGAVKNIHNAIKAAVSQGALGMTLANWAGIGHLTHSPILWPGLVAAGGLAWNSEIRLDYVLANLASLINHHVFWDSEEVIGDVIIHLGRVETYLLRCANKQQASDYTNLPAEKGSILYQLLLHPDTVPLENLTLDSFQRALRHIRKCQVEMGKAKLECDQEEEIISELKLTADLMLSACKIGRALVSAGKNPSDSGLSVVNMGVANLPLTQKTDLANKVLSILETYSAIWEARCLERGLKESLSGLKLALHQFLPEDQRPPELANNQ